MVKIAKLKKGLSVVVPVYNEEKILEKNMKVLGDHLKKLKIDYEIILSENGSTDRSREICKRLCKKNNFSCIFSNAPSFGASIRAGTSKARYDKVVLFPVDLWGMDYFKEALKKIKDYDVVYGSRYVKKGRQERPLHRVMVSIIHTRLVNLILETKYTDIDGIKMYRTGVGKKVLAKTSSNSAFIEVEIGAIIKNSGIMYAEVPIEHKEPRTRHPKYIIKIVFQGMYELIANYGRLRKMRI
ncbi:glycosyltransferase family 2 protein [Candidatus Woesearchaeota archaeon]|nr:glycosyltransferase family 2 protein [Candidatus Woesearchaeota archaeon]